MNLKILICFLAACLATKSVGYSAEILWSHYTQHQNSLKLMVHLDVNPETPISETVKLSLKTDKGWQKVAEKQMYTLASTALFDMKKWPNNHTVTYKVATDDSELIGTIRAIPEKNKQLKLLALSLTDVAQLPSSEVVKQMIEQQPDMVVFSGFRASLDQPAKNVSQIATGMNLYLQEYRKFGIAFKDILKSYPSIIITHSSDIYRSDSHPIWINSSELTQTGTLPKSYFEGVNDDRILSYFTALEYGDIELAILEDRKFLRNDQETFLGAKQEEFLQQWSNDLKESGKLGLVISSNTWIPFTKDMVHLPRRDQTLNLIGEAPVVMIHSSQQNKQGNTPGAILKHGINQWSDGPLAYSLPPFKVSSKTIDPVEINSNFKTDLDQKCSIERIIAKNGFGIITCDSERSSISLDFHPLEKQSAKSGDSSEADGWPYTVTFK